MDAFLKQIASLIATRHPKDTDRVLAVFNNNRSKRFFLKQFESLGTPMFLPKVATIDELVSSLSALEIVPNEFLLFELYQIHTEIDGHERKYKTFEEFIPFGDLMMADFSEIDRYCVDAHQMFGNLHALKEAMEWNPENPNLSPFQQDYLAFYRSLDTYYTLLRQRLLSQNKSYSGMAYRQVAENIATLTEPCPWDVIYFIGFNALSECERRIIDQYVNRGIGHLLADHDPYFLDPHQEAGLFLRKHINQFPELKPDGNSLFGQGHRNITIVECPENLMQCKFAGQLLSEKLSSLPHNEMESTAVVLADESLLMPVLNALPDVGTRLKVNISMGYAYTDSGIHSLILKLLALYRRHDNRGYYHTDLINLLADRYMAGLAQSDNLRQRAERSLRRDNRIRCTQTDIEPLLEGANLSFLFPDDNINPKECLALLRRLTTLLAASNLMETNRKEWQALGGLAEILDNLDALMNAYPFIVDTETLEKVYARIAQRHSIALIGEPMSGLQILGMLETRNLDFRRVILLSANEGILPSGRGDNTLIPLNIKTHFGMPTYVEKDSVYAYNFYRMLRRAEEVWLVYSSESDGLGKGEPSRFIRQVESELAPRFGIEVQHITVTGDTMLSTNRKTATGHKSPRIMQQLAHMGSQGISPTSFADYIECPLKYFYTRVLGISEKRDLEDDLDASELGNSIHNVLEHIYTPLLHRPLSTSDLHEAKQNLPSLMHNEFDRLYRYGRNTQGRNKFLFDVAEKQLQHLLDNELMILKQGHSLVVEAVEESMPSYPLTKKVAIKGKVDRVDRLDGTLRIIDYKTGNLDDKEITYAEPMPSKWLQLMWYALVYCRHQNDHITLLSGIYPLRNLHSDVRLALWDGDTLITPDRLTRFEQMLRDKVEELMNPDIDFIASPSPSACRFCPAAAFCDSATR